MKRLGCKFQAVKCKLFLFFALLLITYYLLLTPIHAISEFKTSYFINYQVGTTGQTWVTQEIRLKNRLKNVYATQYTLNIGSTEIGEIKAWDNQQTLDTKVENLENSTNVVVFLKQKVLGKGEEQNFFLSYRTPDFAFLKGKVLEVGIPLLSQLEDVETYYVTLSVPAKFGQATTVLPRPLTQTQKDGYQTYTFGKDNLTPAQGITATFGQTQVFKFNLKYHLKNPGSVPVETQITLPPDTPFQKLSYQKLEPTPQNVEVDNDGNWLATYRLSGNEEKTIVTEGLAQIFLTPQTKDTPGVAGDLPAGRQALPEWRKKEYLLEQPFWEINDQEVKNLAQELKTPEAIYDYLIKNFIYDYGRAGSGQVERLGAKKALKTPASAICMEFTDTFIALARAIGLPAREVNGFAYTANPKLRPLALDRDVLHAWPEYWNEKKELWIPIDPTWGNTTGGLDFFHKQDLDHFAFVFHGLSSDEPLPPGSFKLEGSMEKDINIEFGNQFSENLKSEIELIAPSKITTLTTGLATVVIKNVGTSAFYQKPINVHFESEGKKVWEVQEKSGTLPPFAEKAIELRLSAPFLVNQTNLNLVAEFDGKEVKKEVILVPFVNPKVAKRGVGIVLGCLVGLLVIKVGYILTKRR